VILQSQLSDALAREAQLRGLHITPRAHVSGWRRSPVTIEVAGEVPTPALRGTVMQIARARGPETPAGRHPRGSPVHRSLDAPGLMSDARSTPASWSF